MKLTVRERVNYPCFKGLEWLYSNFGQHNSFVLWVHLEPYILLMKRSWLKDMDIQLCPDTWSEMCTAMVTLWYLTWWTPPQIEWVILPTWLSRLLHFRHLWHNIKGLASSEVFFILAAANRNSWMRRDLSCSSTDMVLKYSDAARFSVICSEGRGVKMGSLQLSTLESLERHCLAWKMVHSNTIVWKYTDTKGVFF